VITIDAGEQEGDRINAEFQSTLKGIKEYLDRIKDDVDRYRTSMRKTVRPRIEKRREKIVKDGDIVSSLGYPIRKREGAPETHVAPIVRKKIIPVLPPVRKPHTPPDWHLEMSIYEQILEVISSMVHVMERSPRAFRGLAEEDLRIHFLIPLNSQFVGKATGETFNYSGKTDILIRVEDKNIFIAECKIWNGPQTLLDAIDQLLGYTTWRDTKTAILLFNRNKDFSAVIAKAKETAKRHPNFKREISYSSETGFRYIFRQREDPERELTLTILLFDVPK
jgi:hypothetical protein